MPPTLPVYEGCWYHGRDECAGPVVIPHTILNLPQPNIRNAREIQYGVVGLFESWIWASLEASSNVLKKPFLWILRAACCVACRRQMRREAGGARPLS